MLISGAPVSESEKREELDRVLNSTTFARSAQLRAFLRYICEAELAGRGDALTEYQIGLEVLGRRKELAAVEDSSVRNRAYELRQRLERYYSREQPHASVRIEIPRGGYIPRYVRPEVTALALPVETPLLTVTAKAGGARWSPGPWTLLATAVVCLMGGWLYGTVAASPRLPAVLAEAWGPLAEPGGEMVICVATNLHLLVRPYIPPRRLRFPVPQELYQLFRSTRPLDDSTVLYMEPAQLSVPLAELAAVATLAKTRVAAGGSYQILPESEAPLPALMGRNSVLIGTPVNSRAASILLASQPLTIGFNASNEFAIMDQRQPPGKNELYVAQPRGDPVASTLYGLLTVISGSDSAGKARRTAVVTGTGSPGVQAAVEYFCSPDRMRELKARFAAAGLSGFPPNYQVVVRCQTEGIRLLSYAYESHVIGARTLAPR